MIPEVMFAILTPVPRMILAALSAVVATHPQVPFRYGMTRFETKAEDWLPVAIEEAIGKNSLNVRQAADGVRLADHVAQMHQM